MQKRIDDPQTNSQKPPKQIKFTARANPTLLFTLDIKFNNYSFTHQSRPTQKRFKKKVPEKFVQNLSPPGLKKFELAINPEPDRPKMEGTCAYYTVRIPFFSLLKN